MALDDDATPADGHRALMAGVALGDQEAFARLYDALAPVAYGVVRRVLRDPAQSDEVLQEVMTEVWRTAPRYDPERGSVAAWLTTLAHRRAVDRVRSEQAARDRLERDHRRTPVVDRDIAEEVAAGVDADLDRARVARALDTLSPAQRRSVELAFYDGHTHAEVAALLDLPLGTVKTRIRDGLIRLRDHLGVTDD